MADEQRPKATPNSVRAQNLNYIGETEQDLQGFMVLPQNGRAPISADLSETYNINVHQTDIAGHKSVQKRSAWGLQTAVTTDTRLSNLTPSQEIYNQWALKALGLALMLGLPKTASIIDWKRLAICEPSLGRGGFLRNNLQTIHNKQESVSIEEKPASRNIFGKLLGK